MKKGKKITLIILGALLLALIAAGAYWFKGYYDERYRVEDYYYTVVPLDYEIAPYQAVDSDGKQVGILMATYRLTGYNAGGEARELEFEVSLSMQDFYPPGTYIKVSVSKLFVTEKFALDISDVPAGAMAKLRESFAPSAAKTSAEYAAERTSQLAARNTPSLTVACEARGSELVYTYLYAAGARALAEQNAEMLDPVYKAQFRADKETLPELTAIYLEIKLDDGTVVFSQKYDKRVEFGYELGK